MFSADLGIPEHLVWDRTSQKQSSGFHSIGCKDAGLSQGGDCIDLYRRQNLQACCWPIVNACKILQN